MNGLFQCRGEEGSAQIEGVIASAVATIHVPKGIAKLSVKDYVELRKNFSDVRYEYATMVRELKSGARLDRIKDPKDFRKRLDEITEGVGADVEKFRKSKAAAKVNDWLPMTLTTLLPATVALFAGGPLPALGVAGFSFTVNAIAKATKRHLTSDIPKCFRHFRVFGTRQEKPRSGNCRQSNCGERLLLLQRHAIPARKELAEDKIELKVKMESDPNQKTNHIVIQIMKNVGDSWKLGALRTIGLKVERRKATSLLTRSNLCYGAFSFVSPSVRLFPP
jgi:hypothetical protein